MRQQHLLFFFLLASAFWVTVGRSTGQAQCTTCSFTAVTGQSYNLTGNQTLCITGNISGLNINTSGTGNKVCVAPGATWTSTGIVFTTSLEVDVFGTFNANGTYNFNTGAKPIFNIKQGATMNTNTDGFNGALRINNDGNVNFTKATGNITNQSSFSFINGITGVLTATALQGGPRGQSLSLSDGAFVMGNGTLFENQGRMTFSNLENSESDIRNAQGATITIGRYFYNHGNVINDGLISTICGSFGTVGCEFIMGDKGPSKTFTISSTGCMQIKGDVMANGAVFINGTLEITDGDLTIVKEVSGTNGRIIVNNGVSSVTGDGKYLGTNMKFCDKNTTSGAGGRANGFDVLPVNNPSTSVVYTVDCSPNACGAATPVCALTATATPGTCNSATNQYSVSGTISLTSATAGTATITDGTISTTVAVAANATSIPYSLSGLVSNAASHTVVVSLPTCGTARVTYSAPVSCTVAATPKLALTVTPGTCNTATNQYSVSGTLSLTNATATTVTLADGTVTTTVAVTAGQTTASFSLTGLTSGTGTHTVTASATGFASASATYSAPVSCTVAAICSLSAVATAGVCNTATNTYTSSVSLTLVNPVAGTLTVTDGTRSLTLAIAANTTTATASFSGLISDGLLHTVSASLSACGTTSATYTAPVSCSVAPVCSLSAVATASVCNTATNTYSSTVVVTVSNPNGNALSVTNRGVTQTLSTTANTTSNTLSFVFNGLLSDGGSYTTTASLPGCSSTTAAYSAPVSCTVAATPKLALTVTPGACSSATNVYTATGTLSLTNATAGTVTLTDGTVTTTVAVTAGQTSASFSLTGLTSDATTHTVTANASGYSPVSVTYTAPASCSIAPPVLAVVIATPVCSTLTNNYTATGTVSLTNATAGSLTITDNGSTIGVVSLTAGQTTASFTLTGVSGSTPPSHTVVASLGTATASTTYATPASCTVCSLSLTTASLPAGQVGTVYSQTLTTSGATAPVTFSVLAGTLSAGLSLNASTGVISGTPTTSGTASFSIRVTDAKACTAIAALSIVTSAAPVCSLTATATPGTCNTATNTYAVTGSVSATNTPANQSLTISVGSVNTIVTLTGNGPVSYTLAGLTSDGAVNTVSVISSATACGTISVTFTAPASCSIAPPALAVVVATPVCNSATNNFTATGTVSLSNATASTLIITDNGSTIGTVSLTAGQATASFSVSGLSDASSHTVVATLTGGTSASATYTAPVACTVCSTSLTTTALANGQVGSGYSQTLTATGGTTPYTYSVLGTLPAGLTLNPATGEISGTPTVATTSSFTVKVTDAKSCSDTQPLTITVANLPVCSLTATATPATCNTATNQYAVTGTISATNAAINNASPQTLTISVGSVTTTATLTGNGPASYTLAGLNSDGMVQTVTVMSSVSACGMTSVTYTAPASCTIAPPALAVVVAAPVCNTATNNYTATGTVSLTNATAGTLIITDNGTSLTPIPVTAGQTTASFSVSGLSDASSHTVVATLTNSVTVSSGTSYNAPVSCTICSLSLTTSSLPAGQVGSTYSQTLTTSGGTAPLVFSIVGSLPAGLALNADGSITGTPTSATTASFTVSVTDGKNCSAVTPLTITTSNLPVCSLTATATPSVCNTATNQYSVSGQISATNTTGNSSVTVSVGLVSMVVALIGDGPASYTLTGLNSDGLVKTVTVTGSATACGMTSVTYTAPASCTVAAPALTVAVASPVCNTATNNYTTTGTVSLSNTPANATLTITDNGQTISTQSLTAGQTTASFSATGLSNASSHTVIALLTDGTSSSASTTYTAPVSCTQPAGQPKLEIEKLVNKSVAQKGDELTYTIVLRNTGTVSATNVVVTDTFGAGVTYVANSATAPVGTTFTAGSPASWSVPTLDAATSLTLTFRAIAGQEGILYNTATIPGDTAKVCTSVPFKVCPNTDFAFELSVPAGRSSYQWYRDGQLISGATSATYIATTVGSYSVSAGGPASATSCGTGSCCPFIVEESPAIAAFSLTATAPTCTGSVKNDDGSLRITGLASVTGLTYELTKGSSFTAGTPITSGKTALPGNGMLSSTLTAGQYWVRIYNEADCFEDASVTINDVPCNCPPAKCVPFVVKKVSRTPSTSPVGGGGGR